MIYGDIYIKPDHLIRRPEIDRSNRKVEGFLRNETDLVEQGVPD